MLELAPEGINIDTEDMSNVQVEEHKDEREEVAGQVAEALEENFQMPNEVSQVHSLEMMETPTTIQESTNMSSPRPGGTPGGS